MGVDGESLPYHTRSPLRVPASGGLADRRTDLYFSLVVKGTGLTSINHRLTVGALALLFAFPSMAEKLQDEGPLPRGTKAASSHAPFVSGDCQVCHLMKAGAPAPETGDQLCASCHEEGRKHAHAPRHCTRCHNAHDALRPKLLRGDLDACGECHKQR